jgi:hypothetical protein
MARRLHGTTASSDGHDIVEMLSIQQSWIHGLLLTRMMLYTRAFHTIPRHAHRAFLRRRQHCISRNQVLRERQIYNVRLFASDSAVQNDFLREQKDVTVTYITDLEGDKAYLERYVEISKVLEFCRSPQDEDFPYDECITFSQDNAMLVFGGDLWDKGGFDLYIARQLLNLKQRYPNRVFFILGNRDINKLRILQELGWEQKNNGKLPAHPGIMWLKGTGRVGDPDGPLPSDDPVERLKWILGNTMGSPDAFELRKSELEWEAQQQQSSTPNTITDLDVVKSYRESCHPNGEMGQFLSQAHLALHIGPVLVLHGSLPLTDEVIAENHAKSSSSLWDDLSFCMPWIQPGESAATDYGVTTIEEWLDALNKFCRDKIREWKLETQRLETTLNSDEEPEIWSFRGGYSCGPSYGGLLQYGMGMTPDRKKNPTVVYNAFTPQGMPHAFDPDADKTEIAHCTREFFDRTRIQLILAGHKPQGDMPSPIRVGSSSWVLCCDTSYSGETVWIENEEDRTNIGRGDALSFRGEHAVSEVLVNISLGDDDDDASRLESVKYHGVLSDGKEYETVNLLDHAHNSTIGQVAPEDLVPSELDSPHQGRWWTKSIFSDGSVLFHAGEGFNVWNYFSKQQSSSRSSSQVETKSHH